MQVARRTNRDRSDATSEALLAAARALFIAQGYADTSTPQVVAAAGVSRGALYHQFADKRALFRAVVSAEAEAVAAAIEAADDAADDAPLVAGVHAYLNAMRRPGRCRLLLVEGPAVLGADAMRALDLASGARTLVAGLEHAAPGADRQAVGAAAELLSAALDRAALAIDGGADAKTHRAAAVAAVLAVAARLRGEDR